MQDRTTSELSAPADRCSLPSLSVREAALLAEATGFAADIGASFRARAQSLLERACQRLTARSVSFGLLIDAHPGRTMRLQPLGMFGDFRTPEHQRVFEQYLREGLASDPAYPLALATVLAAAPGVPVAVSRPMLIDDQTWYASDHVRRLRLPAGVDDALYCGLRLPDPAGTVRAMTFIRPPTAGPFGPADRAFAAALLCSLDWLFAGYEREREAERLTAGLNNSLWRTLACLQAGDSVKVTAAKLRCTPDTISTYIKRLYKVLGVRNRGELMALCNRFRIDAALHGQRWALGLSASLDLDPPPMPSKPDHEQRPPD